MSAVAESVGHSMGGSSGALYQIFFVALAGQEISVACAICRSGFCGRLGVVFAKEGGGPPWWLRSLQSVLLGMLFVAGVFVADLAKWLQ